MSDAIGLDDLHVSISGSHVLKGVSLRVPEGGVTALLGRNGVGKTTTVRAVLGLVGSTGQVRVLGQDTKGWATHRVVRLGVGYVPEDRDVFAALTVAENLRLAEQTIEPDYDAVYALFPELKTRSRQRAGTLSGGQQQMLSIGRVLLNGWPLLLIDEPSKGLAPRLIGDLVEALARVAESATILLVEQNLAVVTRLAERVIVLDHGEVVHTGSVNDLDDSQLARRLLGVAASP
jgi:branched-chain amino acid transport system ATP-binding protein